MGKLRLIMTAFICFVIFCSSGVLLADYSFRTVADTSGSFFHIGHGAINNNGIVVFDALLDDGSWGVYTSNGAAYTTIADTSGTMVQVGGSSINDSGTVALKAYFDDGSAAVLTGSGGPLTTIATFDSLVYAISYSEIINDGTVAFMTMNFNDLSKAIYTGSGGMLTTITDTSGVYQDLRALSINNNGTVAFQATYDVGGDVVLSGDGDPFTLISNTGARAFVLEDSTSINDSGTVAFWEDIGVSGTSILTGDGGPLSLIADTSGAYTSHVLDPIINNNGVVAFEAYFIVGGGTENGIFTGPNEITDVVIRAGDALGGSTVRSYVDIVDINDNGEILFRAALANGIDGIYVATPIPLVADGDVNVDGVVNVADILFGQQVLGGSTTLTPSQLVHGDVAPLVGGIPAPDGVFSLGDLLVIQRKALGQMNF